MIGGYFIRIGQSSPIIGSLARFLPIISTKIGPFKVWGKRKVLIKDLDLAWKGLGVGKVWLI